jgi:hypothetical protein
MRCLFRPIPIPYETTSSHEVEVARCIKQVQYTRQRALPRGQLSATYYCINVLMQCFDCKLLTAAQGHAKRCRNSRHTQLQANNTCCKMQLAFSNMGKALYV